MPTLFKSPGLAAISVILFLTLFLAYLTIPWVCLFWFGPIWAVAGAIASHLLYFGTLKPGGICLGVPWLGMAVNILVVCLVSAIRLLW